MDSVGSRAKGKGEGTRSKEKERESKEATETQTKQDSKDNASGWAEPGHRATECHKKTTFLSG